MQKQTEQALKKAFIKQAHGDNKIITLGIFVKELEDDIEMAQWIAEHYLYASIVVGCQWRNYSRCG